MGWLDGAGAMNEGVAQQKLELCRRYNHSQNYTSLKHGLEEISFLFPPPAHQSPAGVFHWTKEVRQQRSLRNLVCKRVVNGSESKQPYVDIYARDSCRRTVVDLRDIETILYPVYLEYLFA